MIDTKSCERCNNTGTDPEDHMECPITGAPEPAPCRDCERKAFDEMWEPGGIMDRLLP